MNSGQIMGVMDWRIVNRKNCYFEGSGIGEQKYSVMT